MDGAHNIRAFTYYTSNNIFFLILFFSPLQAFETFRVHIWFLFLIFEVIFLEQNFQNMIFKYMKFISK